MDELMVIVSTIILPVFVIITLGYFMQIKFKMDLQTLARLNIYFLVPGFIFVTLYQSVLSVQLFGRIFLFFILFVLLLFLVSLPFSRLLKLGKGEKTTFSNSVMFFNSGNYGVPVNDLVFRSDPYAMSIQVIILTFQNIFLFSYGIFSLKSVKEGKLRAALGYFRMPVLYAMLAGILLNLFEVPLPQFVWVPATYIADAMIGLALLTLGAQVSRIKFSSGLRPVYVSLFLRLLIGPLVALAMITVFRIDGITAQALLIASAMPTSVNTAVIAQEYDDRPEFAAQIVLFSTLFSAFTVTLVIFIARQLF